MIMTIHIAAGLLTILFGFSALAFAKGSLRHRQAGRLFVLSMGTMTLTGGAIGWARMNPSHSIVAMVPFYLLFTGWLTLQPPSKAAWRALQAAFACGAAIGVAGIVFAIDAYPEGVRARTNTFWMFGTVALLGAIGDWQVLAHGGVAGTRRIVRHVWRMGSAMLIAALSFFIGQARFFPDFPFKRLVLAIPVFLVFGLVLYWVIRLIKGRALPAA